MDYSGFAEFPFPSNLSEEDQKVKDYFLNLTDGDQLRLLNGSSSYHFFYDRVVQNMHEKKVAAR
jgi:hypothetical protein